MRAEPGTRAAMAADDRFVGVVIPENRLHDARLFTAMAANAQLWFQEHTAALTFDQGAARTSLHARRVVASDADDRDEPAGHATACPDLDRTLRIGMILLVDDRANVHAREAANAFVHLTGRQIFSHSRSPFLHHNRLMIESSDTHL